MRALTGLFLLLSQVLYSQTYNNPGGTINTCSGTFYDTGGPSSNYSNSEDITTTICSDASNCISISLAYDLAGGDILKIYDGPDATYTELVSLNNVTGSAVYTSSTGCLTFLFKSNPTGNSTGWDGSISCVSCSLPIELISFTATDVDESNYIEFVTATETNNDFFTLEKSENAIDYKLVSKIKGAGNSTSRLSYLAFDRQPYKLTYYRLSQTDFDGKTKIFPIINLANDYNANDFSIYPNPAINSLTVEVLIKNQCEYSLTIVNSTGITVFLRKFNGTAGLNAYLLDTSNFSIGSYTLIVETSTRVYTKSWIKSNTQ